MPNMEYINGCYSFQKSHKLLTWRLLVDATIYKCPLTPHMETISIDNTIYRSTLNASHENDLSIDATIYRPTLKCLTLKLSIDATSYRCP